jgi:hypothetical protein
MKVVIASIAAVGLVFGGVLLVQVNQLSDQVESLSVELSETSSALNAARDSSEDEKQNAGLKALTDRLTRLEASQDTAGAAAPAGTPAVDLSGVEAQLVAHDKDIAQLKKDLKGSSRIGSAFDDAADRFLGAASGETEGGERQSGLGRLSELRSLFSGDSSELTEDQKQRRAELTKQFQGQRLDWTVRGFDRDLEQKLDDGQKETLRDFLAQEQTSLDELKDQELDKDAREAAQKQIRTNTDARVETILTGDQNASWGKSRSRSSRSRSTGIFGRGRSRSRDSESEPKGE